KGHGHAAPTGPRPRPDPTCRARALRCPGERPHVAGPRSAATAPADPRRPHAPAGARESGPARAVGLRQPALDRYRDPSVPREPRRQLAGGAPGAYRLAQPLHPLHVPATVQAVLAARIDRLPPEEKHLLQTAAVIGTEVSLVLLQAIAEVPEAPLRLGLTRLQAAEFLYETR